VEVRVLSWAPRNCRFLVSVQSFRTYRTALVRIHTIVALPIYDGILVAQSDADRAERAMETAALEHVGFPLPVKVKDARG
jgi:hypothetical protein